MKNTTTRILLAAVLALAGASASRAEDAPATTEPAAPKGILPIPNYTGDWSERAHLAGDFGGTRTDLANKGFTLNVDWVQTGQSVTQGGSDTGTKYGGSLDYLFAYDLDRAGLVPGGLIKMRAESRYGESVNTMSGTILPVSTDGFFPLTDPSDAGILIAVTALNYTQFLSPKIALTIGKFDTLDSDLNEFASGRGNSQFLNTQFLFSGTLALMPYSTLGGGVVLLPNENVTVTSMVLSLNDSSTTSGFSDLDQGWVWASEVDIQYRLGHLPGGTNVGATYMWGTEFFNFNGRFSFSPGDGIVPPTASDTWSAYLSGWQYVFVKDDHAGPMNLANGEPDLEGLGLFWRTAIADDDVNPTQWSLSGGVGGKGMIPSRPHDFFGVGYYYNNVQSNRLTSLAGLQDHTQGCEAFYNVQITPALQMTLDAQVVESAQSDLDPAVIVGIRLKLDI